MKKLQRSNLLHLLILGLAVCSLITAQSAYAAGYTNVREDGNTISGDFTSTYLVVEGPGTLKKVIINTDGINNATLVLRDSLVAGSGKVVWRGTCLAASKTCTDAANGNYDTGLFGNFTTSGTSGNYYNMEYQERLP